MGKRAVHECRAAPGWAEVELTADGLSVVVDCSDAALGYYVVPLREPACPWCGLKVTFEEEET